MARKSYDQAQADRKFLWKIGEPYDVTSGMLEGDMLYELLDAPTKSKAKELLSTMIHYWYQAGLEFDNRSYSTVVKQYQEVEEIRKRWGVPLERAKWANDSIHEVHI